MPQIKQKIAPAANAEMPSVTKSRILIVDDNKEIHNDFRKILLPSQNQKMTEELDKLEALFNDTAHFPRVEENTRTIVSAYQGEEAIDVVKASLSEGTPFSLAFIDVRMPPGIDGIETAKAILDIDPEIQIVICSAYSDYSWHEIVERLENSDRFLILKKPFDNIEVRQISSVLHSRWIESRSDVLTGVLNRRAFATHLIQQRMLAAQADSPLACVMVDLDHFKRINDIYGHLVGDQVLVAASNCLAGQCQPQDSICRYGGEEFCVILPGKTEAQACEWAEHTRSILARKTITSGEVSVGVTGSFGVVSLDSNEISDNAIFLDAADQAMFAAKKRGRNRVAAYSDVQRTNDDAPTALSLLDNVLAREVMKPVHAIEISESIDVALQKLIDAPNGVALVTYEFGGVAGLISRQDLLVSLSEKSFDQASVKSSMQTNVISFSSETPLSEINEFLNRFHVPQVLVMDDNEPIGMIGRNVMLEWMLAQCPSQS